MTTKATKNAKGGGTIRKRSDGRWEARYTLGIDPKTGKQIQKSVYGKTQKEVRQKLTAITAEIDDGTYMEPCRMTLDEWLRDYLTGVKPSTAYLYQRQAKLYIRPALGSVRLDRLEPHTIQRFYNSLYEERDGKPPLSAKSIKNIHGILHRALDMAMRVEYLTKNPSTYTIRPKVVEKPVVPLDAPEQKKLFEALKGNPFETLFLTATFTGMRIGELIGLTWDCVDFENEVIHVEKQLVQTRKKGQKYRFGTLKNGKTRVVDISSDVAALLQELRQSQPVTVRWVFTQDDSPEPMHPDTPTRYFQRFGKRYGIEHFHPHKLRHTSASLAITNGADVVSVAARLGPCRPFPWRPAKTSSPVTRASPCGCAFGISKGRSLPLCHLSA